MPEDPIEFYIIPTESRSVPYRIRWESNIEFIHQEMNHVNWYIRICYNKSGLKVNIKMAIPIGQYDIQGCGCRRFPLTLTLTPAPTHIHTTTLNKRFLDLTVLL